jgi:hypothetical protein
VVVLWFCAWLLVGVGVWVVWVGVVGVMLLVLVAAGDSFKILSGM